VRKALGIATFNVTDLSLTARHVLLASAAALIAIWPTWPPLVQVWRGTEDYAHGFIVALIALGWLIHTAPRIADAPEPRRIAIPATLLILALSLWLLAFKANVEMGKQILAPLILYLAVATGAGWRAAERVAAPIFYLYFALPVWDLIVPVLQWLTVAVSSEILALLGVPVRIDGALVTIPEGRFIVQEGCSGKRYLVVAAAIAWLFGGLSGMKWKRALAFVAIASLLAMLANWIRVSVIIYLGHVTNMQHYFVAREHSSFGTSVFVVLLVVVGAAGVMLRGAVAPPEPAIAVGTRPDANATKHVIVALVILCLPILGVTFATQVRFNSVAPVAAIELTAPAGWRGPLAAASDWAPSFAGADTQQRAAYESSSGERVETYVATYLRQSANDELIHYSNRLIGEQWPSLAKTNVTRRLQDGRVITTRMFAARSSTGEVWVIDYVYAVDGVLTPRDGLAQLLYGLRSWTGAAPSSVTAVAVRCLPGSCARSERALGEFWAAQSATR
jgi:EpsI family protein